MSKKQEFEKIAQEELRMETLERRGSDSLDFKEVGVLSVAKALERAYQLGYKAGESAPEKARQRRIRKDYGNDDNIK